MYVCINVCIYGWMDGISYDINDKYIVETLMIKIGVTVIIKMVLKISAMNIKSVYLITAVLSLTVKGWHYL